METRAWLPGRSLHEVRHCRCLQTPAHSFAIIILGKPLIPQAYIVVLWKKKKKSKYIGTFICGFFFFAVPIQVLANLLKWVTVGFTPSTSANQILIDQLTTETQVQGCFGEESTLCQAGRQGWSREDGTVSLSPTIPTFLENPWACQQWSSVPQESPAQASLA